MASKKSKLLIFSLLVVILAATFMVYLPVFKNGFVLWDDDMYITDNLLIRQLTPKNIVNIFSSFHGDIYYKPLVLLSFAIEYHFFGLNPAAYHITNLILHLVSCVLVFWLIFLLTGKSGVSFLTAFLFGVHPMHVESVAWAYERKDVLYAVFFLASLIFYQYYVKRRAGKYYFFSLAVIIVSFLIKPMAINFLFLLFAFDFLEKRRFDAGLFKEKIPFLIVTLVMSAITMKAYYSSIFYAGRTLSLQGLLLAAYGVPFYLGKLFFPFKLSCMYPLPPEIGGALPLKFLLSPLILIGVAAVVLVSARYTRKIPFGSMFFFFGLLPVLQLVPTGAFFAADRYTYIPSIGIFYLVAEGFFWLYYKKFKQNNILRVGLLCLSFMVAGVLFSLAQARVRVWKDTVTLWSDVIDKYPYSTVAYTNRAAAYQSTGDVTSAISDYGKAIEIGYNFYAYANRGIIYQDQGKLDAAISDYDEAIKINPRYAPAYNNRASIYAAEGKHDQAILDFTQAIQIDPGQPIYYRNRGASYCEIGRFDLGFSDYDKALGMDPSLSSVYYYRARAYLKQQQYALAWDNVYMAQKSGWNIPAKFLEELRQVSGRQK
ncbi:MAG: tetratricopeptide repeat protein [Candidatus Omnitrophica bacterium]|nr:tetratricopeptide repeat protein [Candidatus Omnitrophota bacterium]